jgi:hypothetical protein
MKIKELLLIILVFFSTNAQAKHSYDNLVEFYRQAFNDEVGIGFFKKIYLIKNPNLRNQILSYMMDQNLVVSDDTAQYKWTKFIKDNFKDIKEFQKFTKNNYYDLAQAKQKFIEDLDLERYFDLFVVRNIEDDLQFREGLLKSVIKYNISAPDQYQFERQFMTNLKVKTKKDLEDSYYLTQDDLDFLIKTNFLLEQKTNKLYNLSLEKRALNFSNNSRTSPKEAKKLILQDYQTRIHYLN